MPKIEQREDRAEGAIIWMNLGGPLGVRQTVDPKTGKRVRERFPVAPWLPFINTRGDYLRLPVSNASADRRRRHYLVERYKRKRFVPVWQCPISNGQMPNHLKKDGDAACEHLLNEHGLPLGATRSLKKLLQVKPCEHLCRIIEFRQTEYAQENAEWARQFKSHNEKILDALVAGIKKPDDVTGDDGTGELILAQMDELADAKKQLTEQASDLKEQMAAMKLERAEFQQELAELRALRSDGADQDVKPAKPEKKPKADK